MKATAFSVETLLGHVAVLLTLTLELLQLVRVGVPYTKHTYAHSVVFSACSVFETPTLLRTYLYFLVAITCSSLSLPDNGAIVFSPATSEPYQFGTTATYSCNNNFGLSTNEKLTCGGDGSSPNGMWVGIVPTCVGKL